jgi:Ca2+-transporting ATPase
MPDAPAAEAAPQPYGLTSEEAARRLARYGPNQIEEARQVSRVAIFMRQFASLLIVILLIAAGIAILLGETLDAVAILLVVGLNGLLGYVQEWRTETALAALKNMLTTQARVIRDGVPVMLDTREIVPGDRVVLESGDKVPADIAITAAMALKVDESVLTGESVPVDKSASGAEAVLFMGSNVVAGRAEGVVSATCKDTAFGEIAALTASIDKSRTHLQAQLGRLAKRLGGVALGLGALVLAVGLSVGRPFDEMVLTAIALAVAMVPEGLPAVVTITLALGASAMLRRQALVRRLQAVETLGAATVICTDKTGTLTENQMTVTQVWTPAQTYTVTGTGYDPAGHVARDGERVRSADDPVLAELVEVAMACNHAALRHAEDGWHMVGDPTEGALMTLGFKAWAPEPPAADIVSELPFDADRKRMSVVLGRGTGFLQMLKGATERVLDVCGHRRGPDGAPVPLTAEMRAEILDQAETMAARGQRVLAFASRTVPVRPDDEQDLTFLGLVGMIDPPRPEVRDAVALCRTAGIRVTMITGDARPTAAAVADAIGLRCDKVLTGADLDAMDADGLVAALTEGTHFARTAPTHKMRIVEALQAQGNLVAMTGDGVNDAPALRRADIGVAMGKRGTDVAKDASDVVLLDDNFATIVQAVEEGRRQFANIRRFVRYLLCSNAGEVLAIVVNLFLGGPLIFLATQILWMNLITDGVTAVALGMEKAAPDGMHRPPMKKDSPILDRVGLALIICFGLYTGLASLWVFYEYLPQGTDVARTMAFTAMVVFEKISVFAFRSFRMPMHRVGYGSNPALLVAFTAMLGLQLLAIYWPPLQALLQTVALEPAQLGVIVGLALPLLVVPEAVKLAFGRRAAGAP